MIPQNMKIIFIPGFRDRFDCYFKIWKKFTVGGCSKFFESKGTRYSSRTFCKKNKDDKVSKEFYYLGHMTASGNIKEFTMTNTEKTAVEIEWILDVPVREDIYEYIVNS